jgi:type VI secretion system protein ImpG
MDDLLPFYEQELTALLQHTKQFGQRYPKIAARLGISGENVEDPHIERLIQSVSFLSARIRKKLEDEYPELTESYLQVLFPHYLRAVPSCSIAYFEYSNIRTETIKNDYFRNIPRDTALYSTVTNADIRCQFNTVYDVYLSPLRISSARYESIIVPPAGARGRVHPDVSGAMSIEFDLSGFSEDGFKNHESSSVRVFIDAEASLGTQIREAIFSQTLQIVLETNQGWIDCPKGTIKEVGFLPEDEIFEYDSRTHDTFRLLTEFFTLHEKFNFFDISIEALKKVYDFSAKKFTIKFLLPLIRDQFLDERLLEQIETHHFKLHCTPIVNLFKKTAVPIVEKNNKENHTVLIDLKSPDAYELYDIVNIERVNTQSENTEVVECRPFYSLYHGDSSENKIYWTVLCDESLVEISPGYEYAISLFDSEFNPSNSNFNALSIEVLSTNRNVPLTMQYGLPKGDLFEKPTDDSKESAQIIRCLRRPTKSFHFSRVKDRSTQWRFISQMNLSQASMTSDGVSTIKEIFQIFNSGNSNHIQKIIDGIVSIQDFDEEKMFPGKISPSLLLGVKIVIGIKPENFVGIGISLFAQIMSSYFVRMVHANSFSQVVIQNAETKVEIFKCPARIGKISLV